MRLSKRNWLLRLGLSFGSVAGVWMLSTAMAQRDSETTRQNARQRIISKIVVATLDKHHVSQKTLDDTMSEQALEALFESLDPGKMYFLQNDLDEFQHLNVQLDDLTRKGDMKPALAIQKRLRQRCREAMAMAERLLAEELDFGRTEEVVTDSKRREYAKDAQELRDRWRRQIKWRILSMEAREKEMEDAGIESTIPTALGTVKERVLSEYRRQHRRLTNMDSDQILEWYLNAIVSTYDPHTSYMSPRTMDDFMIRIRSNLQGIGAELREEGDYVYITRVLDGGGAKQSKSIAKGDRILAVAQGEQGEWVSTFQMSSSDVAQRVRGKANTMVRLKLLSKSGQEKVATVTRKHIEIKREQASGELLDWESADGNKLKFGIVDLPGFYRDSEALVRGQEDYRSCSRDVSRLLADFRAQEADAVILDLRNNGGGVLGEAIAVCGLFIDQGPVVQVKEPGQNVTIYNDQNRGVAWDGPLVVLTNHASASASEIVAGALQDYGRAIVVGDPHTHGKGTVQEPLDLGAQFFGNARNAGSMGALKMTTQMYYLPDGDSTQRSGVSAEVVLPSLSTLLSVGENELPFALPHDRVKSTKHHRYPFAPMDLVNDVRTASQSRVDQSDAFRQIQDDIDRVARQRERGAVSIQRNEFMKYWESGSADQTSDADQDEESADSETNEYEEEVYRIVRDYVQGLKQRGLQLAG